VGPVRFTEIEKTSVSMDWLPPKDDGGTPITIYMVHMSENGGEFVELGQVEAGKTKMKVKDLKTGAKYAFRVAAVNKVGASKALESETVVPQRQPGWFARRFIIFVIVVVSILLLIIIFVIIIFVIGTKKVYM
jgi:titin